MFKSKNERYLYKDIYPREYLPKVFSSRDAFFKSYIHIDLLPYQKTFSDAIISNFLDQSGESIYIQLARQAGKSKGVFGTITWIATLGRFILEDHAHGKNFNIGICVPIREQVAQNLNDIKSYLQEYEGPDTFQIVESNDNTIRLSNGTTFYIFSLHDGSSNESKTLHMCVIDEAHKINYDKYKREIRPMLSTTNGLQIFIGVGCTVDNDFYQAVEVKQVPEIYKFDCYEVIKQRQQAYEVTKDHTLLYYKEFIDRLDKDDHTFLTEYLLISDVSIGNFTTPQQLFSLKEEYMPIMDLRGKNVYAGIDWAKSHDSTVITILDENFKICNLYELKGRLNDQEDFLVGLIKHFNIRHIWCDETGLGAGSTGYLQRIFGYNRVTGVTFTSKSKHIMYSNLEKVFSKVRYSSLFEDKIIKKFEKQFLQLEKSYNVNGQMKVQHIKGGHDDYPDSLALACLFTVEDVKESKVYDLSKPEQGKSSIVKELLGKRGYD